MIDNKRYHNGQGIGNKLSPYNTVKTEDIVHNKHEGDIDYTLTASRQNKGLLSLTHSLKGKANLEVDYHKRNGKAHYA